MRSVALYARVSSAQQAQQATVASQLAALQERAKADGHTVLPSDLYVDEGYSGATLARPAMERLRDRVAEGGVEVLYVHSPDRLARRYAYQVLLLEEFARQGVSVIFLHGPAGHSAEDELLVQVQGMIAEYERARILERCRRGKLHKARSGAVNPLSGAPYGYLYVRKSEEGPARYQVLLHEAKVVRSIFQWLVEEQVSIGEITRRLCSQRIPTRKGLSRWDRATVWAILQNPAYMGQAAFGKTEAVVRGRLLRPIRGKSAVPKHAKSAHRDRPPSEWVSIPVPALVSPETFAAAKEQLERNHRLSARNGRGQRYLLQGLTVCARCGYAFYGKRVSRASAKGRAAYDYYRCVGSDAYRFEGGRICHNPQVRVDQLDGYVWDSVRQVLQDPARVLDEWTRRSVSDGTIAELNAQREEARRALSAQEQTLKRLRDAYEAGALELDDLVARSERVRARSRHTQQELKQAEATIAQTFELKAVVGRLQDFAEQVGNGLDNLSWEQRRQLIRTLVARVEIDEGGATMVYRVPTAASPPRPPGGEGEPGPGGGGCQLRGRSALTAAGKRAPRRSGQGAGEARAVLRALRRRLQRVREVEAGGGRCHADAQAAVRGAPAASQRDEERGGAAMGPAFPGLQLLDSQGEAGETARVTQGP
jgi:site-specific DNA recombinase